MFSRMLCSLILVLCPTAQSNNTDKVYKLADGGLTPPVAKSTPSPEYPQPQGKAKFRGTVGLDVIIEKDGKIQDVKLVHQVDPLLDERAIEGVKQWEFTPCKKNGEPVRCSVYMEIDFHLYDEKTTRSDHAEPVYKSGQDGVTAPVREYTPDPDYTKEARDKKIQGIVGMDVVIEKNGRVEIVNVVQPLEPSLDASAVKTLRTWRLKPCQKDGSPVRCSSHIEVSFRLY
jgi:TonB family protein